MVSAAFGGFGRAERRGECRTVVGGGRLEGGIPLSVFWWRARRLGCSSERDSVGMLAGDRAKHCR